jgi:hypothetical protein
MPLCFLCEKGRKIPYGLLRIKPIFFNFELTVGINEHRMRFSSLLPFQKREKEMSLKT